MEFISEKNLLGVMLRYLVIVLESNNEGVDFYKKARQFYLDILQEGFKLFDFEEEIDSNGRVKFFLKDKEDIINDPSRMLKTPPPAFLTKEDKKRWKNIRKFLNGKDYIENGETLITQEAVEALKKKRDREDPGIDISKFSEEITNLLYHHDSDDYYYVKDDVINLRGSIGKYTKEKLLPVIKQKVKAAKRKFISKNKVKRSLFNIKSKSNKELECKKIVQMFFSFVESINFSDPLVSCLVQDRFNLETIIKAKEGVMSKFTGVDNQFAGIKDSIGALYDGLYSKPHGDLCQYSRLCRELFQCNVIRDGKLYNVLALIKRTRDFQDNLQDIVNRIDGLNKAALNVQSFS